MEDILKGRKVHLKIYEFTIHKCLIDIRFKDDNIRFEDDNIRFEDDFI